METAANRRDDMARKWSEDPAGWITTLIAEFVAESPQNTLQNPAGEPAFENPLVGFAAGDDPIWTAYQREHIGPFHWTPAQAFAGAYPDAPAEPGRLTVISYILPQTRATKADNRRETHYPSERWARARIFGEEVNVKLRRHVADSLKAAGVRAVAPQLLEGWERNDTGRFGYASTWSERHAAYAAGLGTFGLCDGLITPRGKAMRAGSIMAEIQIEPTPRPYEDHHAYCLHFSHGVCRKCAARCPADALDETGHDKVKCGAHVRGPCARHVEAEYGFKGYGCGLCQTLVPCESGIPVPPARS
jgi:hypothetical protein